MSRENPRGYVLITPARNEEAHLGRTIRAVISQTVLPRKWVIVSDGSTDRTDEIAREYAFTQNFIHLVRTEGTRARSFSSKVHAFTAGHERLGDVDYDFLGILDADVSFDTNYYESVLAKFEANPRLGIAGGFRYDVSNGEFERVLCSRNSVGGPFQLFRRQCYEDIGGFLPIEGGGEDSVAEIMARMHGWEVESFPELKVYHYRRTGTASGTIFGAKFREGIRNYSIGYHPLFEVGRCVYRAIEKPYVVGGLLIACGYFWASLTGHERPVPHRLIEYLRSEQLGRLRSVLPAKAWGHSSK